MIFRDATRIRQKAQQAKDPLAYERTILANERTFLAYVRTSLTFLGAGLGFLEFLSLRIKQFGWLDFHSDRHHYALVWLSQFLPQPTAY